jgi:hypothetical protein
VPGRAVAGRGGEIDEVLREDAGPHDVDLEHVDVVGARRQKLLVERQLLAGRAGGGNELHAIAGALGPGLGAHPAVLLLLAERAAGNGDLRRERAPGAQARQEDGREYRRAGGKVQFLDAAPEHARHLSPEAGAEANRRRLFGAFSLSPRAGRGKVRPRTRHEGRNSGSVLRPGAGGWRVTAFGLTHTTGPRVQRRQHFLYLRPLPQGHGALRPNAWAGGLWRR